MRITFLGSGSAWPIPRIGCECRQCRSADRRDVRSRSAAILEAQEGGPLLLVDAGTDIYRQLAPLGKATVARIAALVVTHTHPDHFLGLADLAAALPRAIPLYYLEDNYVYLERCFGFLFPAGGRRTAPVMFEPRVMRFGETFAPAAGIDVTPFDAHHFKEFSTAGLIAAAGGRRLAYAPDFRRTEADLSGLDLLAIDGSQIDGGSFGHLSIRDGIELARRVRPGRTLFTHIGHVKAPHAEVEALVKREGGPELDVAHDGLSVVV